jgi:hypothetical protein
MQDIFPGALDFGRLLGLQQDQQRTDIDRGLSTNDIWG